MQLSRNQIAGFVLVAGVIGLTVLVVSETQPGPLAVYGSEPVAIMGTVTELKAVVPRGQRASADKALADAEAALRRTEALMSANLKASELGIFNSGPAGEYLISPELGQALLAGRRMYDRTDHAFDITCRPILELWKKAGKENKLPTNEEKAQARSESDWQHIHVAEDGRSVSKSVATARIDLGGIAKGFGIDGAVEAMMKAGVAGGVVNLGGDLRCFGRHPEGRPWLVGIKNPFGEGLLARLKIREGSVCTSGNYERYSIIDGQRYSHIIDPRPGPRAYMALSGSSPPQSVTVIGPTAAVTQPWGTGLSVLGPEGLKLLPPGIEAMIVTGGPEDYRLHMTSGFGAYLEEWPTAHAATQPAASRPFGGG